MQLYALFFSASHHITKSLILTFIRVILSKSLKLLWSNSNSNIFSSVKSVKCFLMYFYVWVYQIMFCAVTKFHHEEYWNFLFSNLHFLFLPVLTSGIPLQEISRSPSAFTGRNFRNWLLELRNSHSLIKSSRSALIDRLLEGYDNARHGTGVCAHFLCVTGGDVMGFNSCNMLLIWLQLFVSGVWGSWVSRIPASSQRTCWCVSAVILL